MGMSGALDPNAIRLLNIIVAQTHCDVILSSSWRGRGRDSFKRVQKMLEERGFEYQLKGKTPQLFTDHARWREIQKWLDKNYRNRVDSDYRFVVLDDDPDAWNEKGRYNQYGKFVNTNYITGLTPLGAFQAIRWLEGNDAITLRQIEQEWEIGSEGAYADSGASSIHIPGYE